MAASKVACIETQPSQTFSFWKTVGGPTKKNGFKKGRNIIKGKVSEEIGGGLCQLSSIIYITALKANLKIVERYNHSVDIYNEDERFTPLGADATVVYGYKDLRIQNNYDFPVRFRFVYSKNKIICTLESLEKIEENEVTFIRNYSGNKVEVTTKSNGNFKTLSIYKLL